MVSCLELRKVESLAARTELLLAVLLVDLMVVLKGLRMVVK